VPPVLTESPKTIVAVLTSARSAAPDPRVDAVLAAFRRQWLAIARRRYPTLRDDVEDAIQNALVKLLDVDKLATLKDTALIEGWARSVFVHTVLDLIRERQREHRRRAEVGIRRDDDPEDLLRDLPSPTPTPEETASERERLRIVTRCIGGLEVARLKFVDGLPDKEVAARRHLTRDAVAGQLKRFRKTLRKALGETDEELS